MQLGTLHRLITIIHDAFSRLEVDIDLKLIEDLAIDNAVKTYLDYVPSGDVYKYFEAADLVLLPYEQFDSQSGVGSTAVSFRKPMIVSDVGGLPDLVPDRRWVVFDHRRAGMQSCSLTGIP